MSILSPKQIEHQREWAIKYLLPDTCQIFPQHGTITVSASGIPSSTNPAARLWRTLNQIPCRVDFSRAFRPGALNAQTTTVDEYILELPYDIDFEDSDRVVIDGSRFVMRKTKDKSRFDTTVEVIISRIGADNGTI